MSDTHRAAGIKIFLDGVLSAKSAAVLDAYSDGSFGTKVWADAELDELLSKLADISPELRPHFHAIGDAAVRQALDLVTGVRSSQRWTGPRRPVVAHAELIATPDVLRFEELDVEVVISPQWLKSEDTDNHNFAHMSADVVSRVGDFAPLIETGAVVTYGSDWPVSLPDPELAISAGVSHLEKRGYSRERATEALHKICTADY